MMAKGAKENFRQNEKDVLKSYLFVWKVDITGTSSYGHDKQKLVEEFAKKFSTSFLQDDLNAPVHSIVLAKENAGPTELEIYEFFPNSETPYNKQNSRTISSTTDKIELFENIVKDLKNGKLT